MAVLRPQGGGEESDVRYCLSLTDCTLQLTTANDLSAVLHIAAFQ